MRNNVIIELTPLLDVILVILFLVLVQSEGRVEQAYTEAEESYEAEVEAFKAAYADEVERLRRTASDFDALMLGLEEDTDVILLSLVNNAANMDSRSVRVETAGEAAEVPLSWDGFARDEASAKLSSMLAGHIRQTDGGVVFIVFRYDSGAVFVADYRLVRFAAVGQRLNAGNVFFAEIDIR
jgi:hypothetical protein